MRLRRKFGKKPKKTDLCGKWEDKRTPDVIIKDIKAGRRDRFRAALDRIHWDVAKAGIRREAVKEAIRKVRSP